MKILFGNEREIQAAAYYVRYQVFVLEQGIAPRDEFDVLDDTAAYFVAFLKNQPVATVRFQKKAATLLQPDRFCVLKEFRAGGIGSILLATLEAFGVKEGCTSSQLSAEMSAVSFYESHGYHISSAPFSEDGLLVCEMTKVLA